MLQAGTIRPGRYSINGYVKLDLIRRLQALRAPLWREAGLLLCSAFYAFFAYFVVRDVLRSIF